MKEKENMKTIAIESELYARRLVREVNNALRSGKSVYAVDFDRTGKQKVVSIRRSSATIWVETPIGTIPCRQFWTGDGDEICVSREP